MTDALRGTPSALASTPSPGSAPPDGGPAPAALRATGIVKAFGGTRAVDDVDLTLAPGEVRGLLGPNGAGKTTLLRSLFGLVTPDAGTIELLGRRQVAGDRPVLEGVAGFVEDPRFYPYLTARANLEVLALFDGGAAAPPIDAVLHRVGLGGRADDRVSGYSTGMRQRLGIAAALLRAPSLLLLDEPTSGLDPAGARDVAELVRSLSAAGVAVLLSSHQIGEVGSICDAFTVLSRGRVVWDGTAAQLRDQAPVSAFELATTDDGAARRLATEHPHVEILDGPDGRMRLTGAQAAVDAFVVALGREDVAVRRLELVMSPLEAMFFTLTEQPPLELEPP
ncbi:MAG: ABC transporter ATP-binding protein [Solirubrobacterales bacterium]|nr:ABC transporter ATP-binding protein [Solirubrobacterales bacterium]